MGVEIITMKLALNEVLHNHSYKRISDSQGELLEKGKEDPEQAETSY